MKLITLITVSLLSVSAFAKSPAYITAKLPDQLLTDDSGRIVRSTDGGRIMSRGARANAITSLYEMLREQCPGISYLQVMDTRISLQPTYDDGQAPRLIGYNLHASSEAMCIVFD